MGAFGVKREKRWRRSWPWVVRGGGRVMEELEGDSEQD